MKEPRWRPPMTGQCSVCSRPITEEAAFRSVELAGAGLARLLPDVHDRHSLRALCAFGHFGVRKATLR